jgi:hypothetical protein
MIHPPLEFFYRQLFVYYPIETFEKWLRHCSKIFFASVMFMQHDDLKQAVNFSPGKAKNI